MDAIISTVFWVIVIALVLFLVFSCANIVPQQHAYVIERLGKYRTTWNAGLHYHADRHGRFLPDYRP